MNNDRMDKIMSKLARYFQDNWSVGVLHDTKGCWKLKPENASPAYLRVQTALRRHILIKPEFPLEERCLLVDDIDRSQLCEQHQDNNGHWLPGRLVVETSPANYQVWVRCLTKMSNLEKRLYLYHFHSDPGAAPKNRWGRCPGFHNTKAKYMTCKGFPLAKLIWIDWKNDAVLPAIDLYHSSLETLQKNYSIAAKLSRHTSTVRSVGRIMPALISPLLILLMPWRWSGVVFRTLKSGPVFSLNVRTGPIIRAKNA
jgi:hypothetical protein